MRKPFTIFTAVVLLLWTTAAAWAQEQALVTLRSEVLREVEIVKEDGRKELRLEPAPSAMPGEVLLFRITYTNEGAESAQNVQLTNPVPEHMVYEAGSAQGEGTAVTFSVDGGRTFENQAALTISGEDGKVRPAGPADYTHIRWRLSEPIPRNREGTVSFRARLT